MSEDHQTQPDHVLDRWLTTAMASLNAGLDGILDIDAGLSDAQLPGLGDKLVHALDGVVDLDAGLSHIIGGPVPATMHADRSETASGLSGFANAIAARPPHERLAARAWFPLRELRALRSSAHQATRALDLIGALADARTHAQEAGHTFDLAQAGEFDLALHLCRAAARALNRDLIRASDAAGDLGIDLNLDLARARVRNLDLELELGVGFSYDVVGNFAGDLNHCLASVAVGASDVASARDLTHHKARLIDHALARALDLASDFAGAREHVGLGIVSLSQLIPGVVPPDYEALARALELDGAIALDFVRALVIVLDLADARAGDLDRALSSISGLSLGQAVVNAVDRIDEALTSMAGADLTEADLHGIPLDGVRWSHATRWPPGWEDQIRRDSILIEPGLYEIRPGGHADAKADSPTNTPA
ncbi:hypothetical protein [Kutzneria buriramensis]|uniref:Uncharacterized protein n=1 Tax=Kutzneria buriramensis TaxID=1045776 RepID=A0A3E0GY34_9PSEU|nr:hypothetical protein [Kutzneria buriramensis]REH31184.1 hypothetical protein BCF44_122207 [Kutzneria buriramensis]